MPKARTSPETSESEAAARARVDRLADPEHANAVLGEVDTTRPLEQRASEAPTVELHRGNGGQPGTDMVAADPIREHQDKVAVALVTRISRLPEIEQYDRMYSVDVRSVHESARLVAQAIEQLGDHDLVPAELIGKLRRAVDDWARDRGAFDDHVRHDGGEAS